MVKGIDKFRDWFSDYADNYIIIGGAACDIHEELNAQNARATKDLDVIVVVEALSQEFVGQFWQFVKAGKYETRQKGNDKHEFYRFIKPQEKDFPFQLELFSRKLESMCLPTDAVLEPIPADEDMSSLSAILMDDDYYNFVLKHSINVNGIHIAKVESLICLKAKAFIDLSKRKLLGEAVDSKSISKHKNDIFRLAAMLVSGVKIELFGNMNADISTFCQAIETELPDNNLLESAGIRGLTADRLFYMIKETFGVDY
ncbi:MAG: hypothetical protein M0P12_11345 [Paludibacteraceae bacterium]|nr:hypothetical protein [Paludibacteraceae bacterium]